LSYIIIFYVLFFVIFLKVSYFMSSLLSMFSFLILQFPGSHILCYAFYVFFCNVTVFCYHSYVIIFMILFCKNFPIFFSWKHDTQYSQKVSSRIPPMHVQNIPLQTFYHETPSWNILNSKRSTAWNVTGSKRPITERPITKTSHITKHPSH
jgi:hypothetical protein